MRRVLVTGGAGFIGRNLILRLLRRGDYVLCADNFSTGSPMNIKEFKADDRFEFVRHDVTFPLFVEIDQIYHLACPASPRHYQRDPVQTVKTCVMGSINMLGLAKRTGARILQASTSEVYGNPTVHPQTEDYWGNVNPIGPRSCYDEGKRCAETLFSDYRRMHRVDVRIARIFNTYGPWMHPDDGRVVSNFVTQALRGDELTVFGTGGQTRSFCFVDDTVDALMRLMDTEKEIAVPINIGNPSEISVRALAQSVSRLTGVPLRVSERSLPVDDPERRCPDISMARDILGWWPTTNLTEGLQKTIAYFRETMRLSSSIDSGFIESGTVAE